MMKMSWGCLICYGIWEGGLRVTTLLLSLKNIVDWDLNDIYSMLNNDKGTEAIQGIIPPKSLYHFTNLEDAHKGESFAAKKFRRMTKLRFLYLDKVNLTESFEDLRWLCWNSCPLKCLPSEFFPKKLVILELPHSEMRTMWESNMVSQVFDKLKTINMSWSLNITTTPDFTNFPCLETLNLNCCISLEEVHISIGSLARLVCLDLGDCSNLKSLPDSICSLRALETLNISRCSILKALPIDLGNIESLKVFNAVELTASSLPDSIGRLSNLVKLRLSYSKNLKAPPDSICNLRSLEILCINSCNKLEEMPHQLGRITSLRKLDASVNKWLKMLPDISQLSNIGHLNLTDCFHLLSIAALPPNLKCLTAKGCTSLERLPNLSNLKRLEVFDIEDCWCLKEILGLEELISIEELMLKGCNSSLLAYTLTKRFFEVLSGFAHEIRIHISPTGFPDWISHSSNLVSTMSFNLTSNVSHKFLAMILCIRQCEGVGEIEYSVKYTPSGLIQSNSISISYACESLLIEIIPGSIFSIRDDDSRIELTSNFERIHGIHLLYKSETTIIGDCDSTAVNVEDERSHPSKRMESDN